VSGISDTNVDPYTGAEKFAEGGIAATPQAQAQAPVALQSLPNQITNNSVNTNNALMQQLQNAMVAPRAPTQPYPMAQQAPVQQAPVQQAPVQPYQGYSAPTFTRPTVAPIEFGNAAVTIPGSTAYAAKQKADAEAEAARQAAMFRFEPGGSELSAGATGGLPKDFKHYAAGGDVSNLGGYSDGGRMLKGPGDGMSDNIPATIGGKQPARLADGEFVVPADVVSHLGNGSTDAGAKHLYNMMDKVRKARTGTKKQGTQIKPEKYLKG
jgi:hypothetical protein